MSYTEILARPLRRLPESVDEWLESWPGRLGTTDLACFRIVYASYVLLFSNLQWSWTGQLPASWFAPPPGPMALLAGPPPSWLLDVGTILLAIFLGALLVGYRTRLVSLAIPLLWLLGNGVEYSWGKIDHGALLVSLAPVFLGPAGWGDTLSVDARRGRVGPARRWPITLFAVSIALAFFTAAVPKIATDWLSPTTHAIRGHILSNQFVRGRDGLLAPWSASLDFGALWLLADIVTVLLEAGLLIMVLRWTSFRAALLVLIVFHLFVLLTMNISFPGNVLIYGAFFPWSVRGYSVRLPRLPASSVYTATAAGLAIGAFAGAIRVIHETSFGALLLGQLGVPRLFRTLGLILMLGALWMVLEVRHRAARRAKELKEGPSVADTVHAAES